MSPIPGTEALHPWAQILGVVVFVIVTAILAAWTQHKARRDVSRAREEERKQASTAVTAAAAVVAAAPVASNWSNEVLIQTLSSLQLAVTRLNDRLEEQDREREEEERAELRELRRIVRDIRPRE